MNRLKLSFPDLSLFKVIGWGSSKAYLDKMSFFSQYININFISYIIDRNSDKWGTTTTFAHEVKEPESLISEDTDKLFIIIFSSYEQDIKKDLERKGFSNFLLLSELDSLLEKDGEGVLTWFKKSYQRKQRLISIENNKMNSQEFIFNELMSAFKNLVYKGIPINEVMKIEFHHLSSYLKEPNKSVLLYGHGTDYRFVVKGTGPLLACSLLYNRLDQTKLMESAVAELDNKYVTRIYHKDDYIKLHGSPAEGQQVIGFTCLDEDIIKDPWYKRVCSIIDLLPFPLSKEEKKWLGHHVILTKMTTDFFENFMNKENFKASLFLFDYYREEYIISTLSKRKGLKTFTIQHGFYLEYNTELDSQWNRIYHCHYPSTNRIVWGESSKNMLLTWGISEESIKILGNPRYCMTVDDMQLLKNERRNFGNQQSMGLFLTIDFELNKFLIELCKSIAEQMHLNCLIKFHPEEADINQYQSLLTNNFKVISEHSTFQEIADNIDFAIMSNSTVFYELTHHYVPCFIYKKDKEQSQITKNPLATFYTSQEILKRLVKLKNIPAFFYHYMSVAEAENRNVFAVDKISSSVKYKEYLMDILV
ncbi:hypothetical protein [Domibacillus enclensis]|uniref:CDP-Glycerol:Poly(Glycerophosphate) glycerophosphotransferase n=1 Tax=Domibacillus enclensis TaxID=1017273 RepID=A0A1N6SC85_9BACI|nr:hypothetical protein [Domibacillus enclensis]OXS79284.1 hypothetical protein B1B05_05800 [Domibacillus enclensis]SIQ38765.1 hypothetical protein SAMN05443094_102384 [Domibacillus enclensis]